MTELFDASPYTATGAIAKYRDGLSSGQRLTLRNKATLEAGQHPATRLPLIHPGWKLTCGDCAYHTVQTTRPGRRFHKCRRVPITNGPGTDIRVSWPACTAVALS